MKAALDEIRVLDMSHVLAGPTATMVLADLGAEVIHIEPPWGDDSRGFGPFVNKKSAYYVSINRNKKSVVVDIKKDEGKEIIRDLIKISDVLVENFRPGTMEKLGFSYEEVSKINPKIIYASISGFGHDTLPQYRHRPSYDMIAQAYSGLMSITGPEGGPPVRVGTSVGDIVTGYICVIGVLSALYYREKTGRGQRIDISMIDSLFFILENAVLRYTVSGEIPKPLGTAHPSITPFQAFRTKDNWIVIPIGNDNLWNKFSDAIRHPELKERKEFKTNKLRTENKKKLIPIIEKIIRERTTREWLKIFEEHGIPSSPINTIDRIVNDPHINYRDMLVELNQPDIGKIKIAGSPLKLSETPGRVYSHAPLLGENTKEVLRNLLNYSKEKIKELESKGVILVYKTQDNQELG